MPIRRLNPALDFGDTSFGLMPQLVATLTMGKLGRQVGSIAHLGATVTRAVDTPLSGVRSP